jgi:hypothetical protein
MKHLLLVLCLLWPAANARGTTATTDYSDIYFIHTESGWGMQLVQSDNTIFATLFIYGSDGKPTWAVATLTLTSGGPVSTGDSFTGDLYVTTGPYFGSSSFDPNTVNARKAGTLTFQKKGITYQLTYSIDGVVVSKTVERQTLVNDHVSGNYTTAIVWSVVFCNNAFSNGFFSGTSVLQVAQTGATTSVSFKLPNGALCTESATYTQEGRFGQLFGNFACSSGESGHMDFYELTNRVGVLSGRIAGDSVSTAGCIYNGRFTGLDPSVPVTIK